MPTQTPNPFAQFISRLTGGKVKLIGTKLMHSLINAMAQDRIIAGDGIEESPTGDGRILSVVPGGPAAKTPFAVSVFQNDRGVWIVQVLKNRGWYIDVFSHRLDKQLPEKHETSISQNKDYTVVIQHTYGLFSDSTATLEYKVISGTPDSLKIINSFPDWESSGISYTIIAGIGWLNNSPVVTQIVRDNIRTMICPYKSDSDQYSFNLVQVGDIKTAYISGAQQ